MATPKKTVSASTKKSASSISSKKQSGKKESSPTSALKTSEDRTTRDNDEDVDLRSMEDNRSAQTSTDLSTNKTAVLPEALRELFLDEIKDIYWAEKQLTKVLPEMQQAAASDALVECIGDHSEETKGHVERLEQIFELLGEKPRAKKCDAMEGITKEGESIVEDTEEGTATRDAGVIMASQKVEHYEIATYGSLKQIATVLQLSEIADLLGQTLEEEKAADEKLSQVAAGLNFAESE